MTKPRQSSFRRVLLRRLLLLSIPVLLTGEVVAYKKARSGFLETARHNLTASAVRKADSLQGTIGALRSNLATATGSAALLSGSQAQVYEFLDQFQQASPVALKCVQLTDLQTQEIRASTCGKTPIVQLSVNDWSVMGGREFAKPNAVHISLSRSPQTQLPLDSQLNLVFSAPVQVGSNIRYALSARTALYPQPEPESNSITGYTVVIDQAGEILAHPIAERVGRNINQEADAARLKNLVDNAIAGRQDAFPLFAFEERGAEWLAGYSTIPITLSDTETQTWVVLATTSLDTALYSLGEIKQVLIILTLGLLTAILLSTLYLTRDLARPIEQLSDYALRIRQRYASDRAPKDFKVRELNLLAEALDNMVERLEDRAKELETAWQEAQEANQMKSEFLATTSHELRTPLNAIIGCVRLVRDGCCDDRDEELEFLQQADDAAIHLLQIINDLLDIAKVEAGKVELNLQSVPIQDLCHQCLKMVQPRAEMKRLTLTLDLDPLIERVLIDERRVSQMVINLLSNAVKFTPEGGHVKLSAWLGYGHQLQLDPRPDRSPINPETAYLCLEISDSGIGIPQERWHLLFRPFQQIDSSLTRKHEGTGLGLALTKRLAELHGGTLSFSSAANKGSIFRIWLPLIEMSKPESSDIEGTQPEAKHPVSVPNS
ncbi:sensor histidine kinase [Myxacorys almedinensis]|uniref:histidine kinase n=1 Tax=Myxacorys almedinensis A TaxID=2690445 RepID=A0A8J7YYR4_9CYAN|nr:sensor histidine kinase [Myxacorys almedinensis]NDJ17024.1 sensor histidine kinase [Myxacorys almedinensis A]